MTELLNAVASWSSLLLVLVVFGFAPGFCLRIIVRAYPREDPRRAELIAELYGVPRLVRPLWVAEQLEVALFEGLPHRWAALLRWFARRRRTGAQTVTRRVLAVLGLLGLAGAGGLVAVVVVLSGWDEAAQVASVVSLLLAMAPLSIGLWTWFRHKPVD